MVVITVFWKIWEIELIEIVNVIRYRSFCDYSFRSLKKLTTQTIGATNIIYSAIKNGMSPIIMGKTKNETVRIIAATILLIIFTVTSFVFVAMDFISGKTFCFSLVFNLGVFCCVASFESIALIKLGMLHLKFKEAKKVENNVKELARAIVMIESTKPTTRVIRTNKYDPEKHKNAIRRLLELTRD